MHMSITINRKKYSADVEPSLLLLDFLRHTLRLTGTKVGCESGQCGACNVLFNGMSIKSCSLLAVQADDCEVTTIEGLAKDGQLSPLQEAFLENHAVQHGFVTPGQVISLTES